MLGTSGVGSNNLYGSGVTKATSVTVALPANGVTVFARLYQEIDGVWQYTDSTYKESGTPVLATMIPAAPAVLSTTQTFTWSNGAGPSDYWFLLGTTGVDSSNLYASGITTATSATVTLPAKGATLYARFYQKVDGVWQYTDSTYTESGPVKVSALSCSPGAITGAGTLSCQVTVSNPAGTGGQAVNLSSNNTSVAVPSSAMVVAGSSSASFTATVSAVSAAQTAMLTATAGGGTATNGISLCAAVPTLSLSTTSVSLGTVAVGGTGTGSVTLTSSGTAAVTVSAGSLSGTGYTVSGVSFPLTLNPGQTATLTVKFAPTAAGLISGSMTLTSNSSTGTTSTISLSGTGQPVLSGLTCTEGSITGAASDACTVTLNSMAATGGFPVSLASNSSMVTVPASITVAAGAAGASFSATVSAVSSAQTATISASASDTDPSFVIQLNASVATLSVSASSLAFGNVNLNSATTQSVTLTSTGTASVTVSTAAVSGTGLTISGASFPLTLSPNQTATLNVQFDPTSAGVVSGTLTIISNSSTNATDTISLSGTGVALPALTSPTPGRVLPGSTVTFAWTAGVSVQAYALHMNTIPGSPEDPSQTRFFDSGVISSTSITVTSVPMAGTTVYTILGYEISGTWQYVTYSYTEASTTPVLSGLNCTNSSMTAAGTDGCTVSLNSAAASGGFTVSLSSNAAAVTVPSSITVPAGATSASFTATVSAVSAAQTATLTASSGGTSKTFAINLGPATPTLTLQSTSVAFGDVTDGSPSYQSVTLTSSGTAAVTLSAGSVSGTGYTISGVSFPLTLNPGQTATLEIEFDPTASGVSNGSITLTSNSSTGSTSTISLSGTGEGGSSYEVNLTWDAPTGSSDPVTGYNIYRAVSGSSTYELVNSSLNSTTAYSDTTVQNSTSYIYYVASVDNEGNQSVPSNTFTVAIP
ncbi:MAG: choice-of-anchor D domain-containing protein [Terracidiphilus sp.]